MSHVDHFTHGPITPAIGYVFMVMAAVIGLMCTVRARESTGSARRNWLITGAASLAAGIWTLHFIAMLGFRVSGSPVRYNVPLTVISLIVAFLVVGAGVLMVGYGKNRTRSLLLGGLGTGVGVAAMHYSGMASVHINGTIHYRSDLVTASVAIAIVAATVALWLVFNIRTFGGAVAAALVMGLAVSSMHYTAMAAVSADLVDAAASAVAGATATEFLVPFTIGLGALLLAGFTVIAVSPVELRPRDEADDDYVAPAEGERENLFVPRSRPAREQAAQPGLGRPPAPPSSPSSPSPAPSTPAAARPYVQSGIRRQPTPLRRAPQPRPLPTRNPRDDDDRNDPPVVQSWLTRPDSRS
jgi:NO-binding membrane sensor protein with MHYT domain